MVDMVPTRWLMKLCQQKIAGKHVLKARSVKAMRQIREEDANYMKKGCKRSAETRGQEPKAKIATIKVKIKDESSVGGDSSSEQDRDEDNSYSSSGEGMR